MKQKPYILWLGGVYNERAIGLNSALSPAATRWQGQLTSALVKRNMPVVLLSHVPARLWPLGALFPGKLGDLDPDSSTVLSRYCNLPIIRGRSLSRSFKRKIGEICLLRGNPCVIISYNPTLENVEAGSFSQRRWNIPWVDLCADSYHPGDGWLKYPGRAKEAKGHVFLSRYAYESCPWKRKLHLDGGIRSVGGPNEDNGCVGGKRGILYSGSMSKWGGVEFLLEAFQRVGGSDIELWLCGEAPNAAVLDAAGRDKRIKCFGLLSESHLDELYRSASIFVNPRPSGLDGNSMNFPSKLLRYLGYGKPIVSTWTLGLSEDYRHVLMVPERETAECLATTIRQALALSPLERLHIREKIAGFASSGRTWESVAGRLLHWIETEIVAE